MNNEPSPSLSSFVRGPRIYLFSLTLIMALTASGQQMRPSDVRDLPANQMFEREMTGGQIHRYSIELQANEFLKVDVEQKGIDVLLVLRDTKNNELARMDSPNEDQGFEFLSFVADQAGRLVLDVESLDAKAGKGAYTIRREVSRAASADDRKQADLEQRLQKTRDQLAILVDEVPKMIDGMNLSTSRETLLAGLNKATQGLHLAETIKGLDYESLFLFLIARMYEETGDNQRAIEYYEKTLTTINIDNAIKAKLKFLEVSALKKMGRIYENDLSNPVKAQKLYNRGLSLYQDDEEDEDKGVLLRYFGDSLVSLRFYPQAEESYLKAVKVFQKLNLHFQRGATLGKLGRVYYAQGNKLAEALQYLLDSETLLESSPANSEYQNTRLLNLGVIYLLYDKLNDPEKAAFYKDKASALQAKTKDAHVEFANKFILGMTLSGAGKTEEGIRVLQEALALATNSNLPDKINLQSEAFKQLSLLHLRQGRTEEAKKFFDQAFNLVKDLSDHTQLANLFESFGDGLFSGEAFELAEKYYGYALSVSTSEKNRPQQVNFEQVAGVLNKRAKAQLEQGDQSTALMNLRTALTVEMSLYQQTMLADMLQDRMAIFAKLNRKRLAIFFGKQAVALSQEMRATLKTFPIETQKSFLRKSRRTYEDLVVLLLQENRFGEALQHINLYQDQEFFDFANDEGAGSKELSFSQRETEALSVLRKLQSSLRGSKERFVDNPDFEKLDDALVQIELNLNEASDERDSVLTTPDLTEMQTALIALTTATKRKPAALYTVVGAGRFHIILVIPGGEVKVFESPIPAEDLNTKILQFYALLQSPKYDPRPLGKQLYDIIFKPIEAELKRAGVQTLMWQLDGNLRYIPMAALFDGEKYLVESYQNVVFTRGNRERLTRSVSQNWTGVGFSSSKPRKIDLFKDGRDVIPLRPLPGANAVLQSVFRVKGNPNGMFDGEVFLDDEFSEKVFYEAIKRRPLLVFISSHFVFRPGDDSRSFLLLGDGTPLPLNRLKEHKNLFAGVELLTLSACNTAATQSNSNGKEIDGFAELAQRLGANAVMATLWQVTEGSTNWLMKEFYASKVNKPETTKAEALKNAQLRLLEGTPIAEVSGQRMGDGGDYGVKVVVVRDALTHKFESTEAVVYVSEKDAPAFTRQDAKPFAHPYYWASFVLFGNWK